MTDRPTSSGEHSPGGLMAVDGAAARLGVSARFVRRLVAERRIPYVKVGKFVRFDPGELEVWIDERRVRDP